MKIGVFDSGAGGQHVAQTIQKELPNLEVIHKEDKAHVPYGNRDVEEIHSFVRPIFQQFISEGCQVIVVACNTVTTNLIEQLRVEFNVPMVGMEPAVKPAAENTKTKVIAVFATPKTLSSKRYQWLKSEFAKDIEVLEPDVSDWATMIETNTLDRDKVATTIDSVCDKGADQLVLGCTHYHWIEDIINQESAGRAAVIQPEIPVIVQLKRVISEL